MFLYLAYYFGLRRGELLSVTWKQVNFEAMELTVTKSKSRKYRVLPLTQQLAATLRDWQHAQGETKVILPWSDPELWDLYKDSHAIQTAAGIPRREHFVPHDFRSSCASALIRAGVPTAVVKDVLGLNTLRRPNR